MPDALRDEIDRLRLEIAIGDKAGFDPHQVRDPHTGRWIDVEVGMVFATGEGGKGPRWQIARDNGDGTFHAVRVRKDTGQTWVVDVEGRDFHIDIIREHWHYLGPGKPRV